MNKESKKLSWAIGLVAGLGVLSIAYAALSSTLYINGDGAVDAGAVQFTDCAPTVIGTTDTTSYTTGGVSGDLVSGAYAGPYNYSAAEAIAFGKAASGTVAKNGLDSAGNVDGGYNDGGANMQIWRSSNQSHHYGDSLTIKGTELYDYGSFVIYKVTLTNTAKNKMKLVQVPTIQAYFTPADGTQQTTANANVKVTVHSSQANALSDTPLAVWTNETTSANCNYLAPNGTCDWYLKISRLAQNDSAFVDALTGGRLVSGTFTFTANLADANYTGTGANPGVWVTAEASA